MYQQLLELYFSSKEYSRLETNEIYLQLTETLQHCLSEKDFLDIEEILHMLLIHTVETAFLAGCQASSKVQHD